MIVKCIANNSELVENWGEYNSSPLEEILIIGKYYIVYAITFSEKILYDILTIHSKYTFSYPAELFEIIDNRLPNNFCLGTIETGNHEIVPFISFKEWVNDRNFYAELVDRKPDAVNIFEKYSDSLQFQHKLPGIEKFAIELQPYWVQCPECADAWELSFPFHEMCRCPKCGTRLLNPFPASKVDK